MPAYIQLYNYLVQDIVAGIYPLDSRLPSKRIIAEETGVSLITVEHTMNLLSDDRSKTEERLLCDLPGSGFPGNSGDPS